MLAAQTHLPALCALGQELAQAYMAHAQYLAELNAVICEAFTRFKCLADQVAQRLCTLTQTMAEAIDAKRAEVEEARIALEQALERYMQAVFETAEYIEELYREACYTLEHAAQQQVAAQVPHQAE